MRKRRVPAFALAYAALTLGAPARADDPPKIVPAQFEDDQPYVHEGISYRNTTAVRYNPLGLSTFLRIGYTRRLLGPQESIFLQRTYLGFNTITTITPAYARGGVRFDVQPLSFLQVLLSYEGVGLFGTFGSLQSFQHITDNFSDSAQTARENQRLNYATGGGIFTAELGINIKLGPILFTSWTDFVRTDLALRPGDPYYYDLPYALLAQNHGWMCADESDLSYQAPFGLMVGARYGIYNAFFDATTVAENPSRVRAITPIQFAGPLIAWKFFEVNGAKRFNAPIAFVNVNWWIKDPYRTGQEVSRAVPYVVAGFTYRGDLLATASGTPALVAR